jgi:hypothetical protein
MSTGRQTHTAKWMVTTALIGALAVPLTLPLPAAALAQDTVTPIAPQQAALPVQPMPPLPVFTQPQIDAMVAPIALYPDQLLGDMLMAAAYPQEVAAADQWVHDPAAGLRGEALAAALAPIDWDPSVKSLVPFPQVLDTMAQHPDWTQDLGAAFIDQPGQVMGAVQRLRREAWARGMLRPTPQLAVVSEGGTIVIAPASPDMLYVPVYNPAVVYGPWPYPAPPVELYSAAAYGGPIVFGAGFVIVRSFWGWNRCDWSHHRVDVDPPRVNAINARLIERDYRPRVEASAWHVDPQRRQGPPAHGTAAAVAPHGPRAEFSGSHPTPAAVHPQAAPAPVGHGPVGHAQVGHAPGAHPHPAPRPPHQVQAHAVPHGHPPARPAAPHPAVAAVPHAAPAHAAPHPGPHPAPAHAPEHSDPPEHH